MDRVQVEKLFRYAHLPPNLQAASKPFHDLAVQITEMVPSTAERTLALRALWEAKNLVVWAAAGA